MSEVPLYEYRCTDCESTASLYHPASRRVSVFECVECGGEMKRRYTAPALTSSATPTRRTRRDGTPASR